MKKLLLFIISISIGLSIDAQCLGEDCSIKGRNKARASKSKKMTGKRARKGSQYSVGGRKKSKRRRGSSKGFDPFASSDKRGGGAGGFDPFADSDKKSKRKNKKGSAYDPFGKKVKSKYKGRSSKGGYDPFDDKKGKRKGKRNAGYDPFEDKSKSRRRRKTKGGTWTAKDGKKTLKVKYKSAYSSWDSSSKRGKKSRGKANDSWIASAGGKAKVKKGGGTWNDGSSKRGKKRSGKVNDTWKNGSGKKSVSSAGGLWYSRSKGSGRANKYQKGGGNDNWDSQTTASTTAAPRYERVDNTPKSYSDYENASISGDLIYDRPYQYKYSLIAGTIYQHTNDIKAYLSDTKLRPILGAEFGVEWPTTGSKNYHHYFNIPTLGLGFTYLNLGNEEKLGSAFAIYPYIDMPLLRTDPFDINLTYGFGLGGVTKWNEQSSTDSYSFPDDSETMPMFSSPLNVYIKGGLNLALRPFTNITNQKLDNLSHYTYTLGVYLTHMSNGSFSSPNHGLNMLTAELGMKYTPPVVTPVVRTPGERLPHYFYVDIMGSAFMRELDRDDTRKYLVGNVNLALYLQAGNIYRIGLGVDAFYDETFSDNHLGHRYSDVYTDYFTNRFSPNTYEHRVRGGACLSNEFVIGRVTAAIDGGYYVYDNIKPQYDYDIEFLEKTYFRFAMKYRLTTNLFGVVALKTHMLQAEYISFGLGYSILL